MATLFWVGGSAAYDGVTNTLATTTGGTATVAVIAAGDTVTFDNLSPAGAVVTTSAAITCTTLTTAAGFTGSITLSNPLTVTGTFTHNQGTLDTNGQTCAFGMFTSSNTNTRAVSLGASTITLSGTGFPWNFATSTGLTFTAGTSNLIFTGTTVTVSTGGQTFASITMTGAGVHQFANNNFTVTNITRTGTAATTDTLTFQNNVTINGSLTVTGNSFKNFVTLNSSAAGVARTITLNGTYAFNNTHVKDISAAGTAKPFNVVNQGNEDLGNNSFWIFGSTVFNNYQQLKVGDGMSVSEKIR